MINIRGLRSIYKEQIVKNWKKKDDHSLEEYVDELLLPTFHKILEKIGEESHPKQLLEDLKKGHEAVDKGNKYSFHLYVEYCIYMFLEKNGKKIKEKVK